MEVDEDRMAGLNEEVEEYKPWLDASRDPSLLVEKTQAILDLE